MSENTKENCILANYWQEIQGSNLPTTVYTRISMKATTFRRKSIVQVLFAALVIVLSSGQFAQAQGVCGSDIMHRQAIENNPQAIQRMNQLEQFTAQFIANQRLQRTSSVNTNPTFIVPVTVHVMHNNGPENVSTVSIIREIELLNRNFQRRGSDTNSVRSAAFRRIMGNANIEFRLARIDPNGRPTDGITRHVTPLTATGNDNVKGIVSWPTDRYFNIWIVRDISIGLSGLPPGSFVAGYAYFPGSVSAEIEGVVLRAGSMGNTTLTHEVGHYLNLNHPFINNVGDAGNCNLSDNVDDTPPTRGTFSGCDSAAARCPGQPMPNTENYMDYADCSHMFTIGQIGRMHAAASSNLGGRLNMVSEANLIATGVSYPRFKAIAFVGNQKSSVCLGENITMLGGTFIDYAQGNITYNWQIEGASASTITGPNPVISFTSPGFKRVKLVVSNAIGSDSITIDSLFNVSGARVIGRAPYIQTFSNTNLLSPAVVGDSAWTFNSSGTQNFTFSNLGIEGNTGKSLVLRPFNNGAGSNATLETPPILTRLDSINEFLSVHFYYAASRRTSSTATTSDIVTVSASNDCGRTWTNIATINTPEVLYTTNRLTPSSIFIPNNQGEWKFFSSARIPTALYRTNNLQFRINYNAVGTNTSTFYIDNFQVALRPVLNAKAKLTEAFDLNVVPNPSVGNSTIRFTAQSAKTTTITVSDVAGRTVGNIEINPEIGINELPLSSVAKQLKAGVYTLRISDGSAIQVRKFVAAE